MKIKILGCSNSWTSRFTSCYLLNDNIMLDCGADAYKAYLKTGKSLSDIKLFLITHFHGDHIYGMNIFLSYVQRNCKDFENNKLTICGLKGIREKCEEIFQAFNVFYFDFSPYINFIELDDGDTLTFENFKISTYKLDHGDVEDLGYLIEEDGKVFGYTGDTTYIKKLDDFIEKCDLCFVEMSRLKTNTKHLGLDKFKTIAKKHKKTNIKIVHCDEEIYVMPALQCVVAHENDEYVL